MTIYSVIQLGRQREMAGHEPCTKAKSSSSSSLPATPRNYILVLREQLATRRAKKTSTIFFCLAV
jgi:hypothetical protein